MRPVSLALDQLQSEEKAFMGILLPTLAMAIKKLRDVLANNEVAVCVPLVTVLIDSIKKRFHEVPHCTEYELAAAIHPYFRLSWLSWLYNNDEVAAVEKESQLEMRLINVVERQSRSHESSGEEVLVEDPNNDFFGSLFESQKRRKTSVAKMVESYLRDPPNKDILAALYVCKNLKNVFIKLNTPLPSSAAVERLFSLGKDVLRPKRASLSDEHFEMMVFLKGNLNK